MDAWNPDQLKRMQAGGNAKLNAFLETYGVTKHTDIKEKYNSKGAEFYREKIRAEIDGKSYTPPPPSAVRSTSMPRPKSYGGPLKKLINAFQKKAVHSVSIADWKRRVLCSLALPDWWKGVHVLT